MLLPNDQLDDKGNVVKADDAGRAAFRKALGVPETPEGYDIPVPEGNPYPEYKNLMAKVFHEADISPRQARAIAMGNEAAMKALETQIRAAEDAASQQGLLQMQTEWGANYNPNLQIASRGREFLRAQTGISELQERQMESMLGTDKFLKMMYQFGAGNKEMSSTLPGGGGTGFGNAVAEAQSRMDQITADRAAGKLSDHAYRALGPEIDQLIKTIGAGFAQASERAS